MSSQSLPVPVQAFKLNRSQTANRAWSLRAAFIGFVSIVILFRWLHLVVSLQVASTDRQIQMSQDTLSEVERSNGVLLFSIAEASSPRSFAARAAELGYGLQSPAYVISDRPILTDGTGTLTSPAAEEVLSRLVTPSAQDVGLSASADQDQAAP
ncbi:MAG TPA: hypothetical protein PKO09_00415 [Anaerolineae bacterium]|nr:hypothetical protein [Anaerolineae bacterium]